jgi:endonuclease/exonuclease/phosphatase family metal-dependent hydrolase
MFYYIIILFGFILFSIFICQKTKRNYYYPKIKTLNKSIPNNLTIITYNIQKFPWSMKSFKNIRDMLHCYDVILLQECYDDTCNNLQNMFPNYYIYRDTLKGINLFSSGLVILSIYPIKDCKSIQYKNYNIKSLDWLSQKGFMVVNINNIIVINTHLQSSTYKRYNYYALKQFDELLNYLKTIKCNYIVGGDFNIDIMYIKYLYDNTNFVFNYPSYPTIYINYKTGDTMSQININNKNYEDSIFDYYITNNLNMKNIETYQNDYSDHNPVTALIEM